MTRSLNLPDNKSKTFLLKIRNNKSAAASGWAGWALAHPEFGISVNPITTRGADYAQRITASPPGFENLAASLYIEVKFGMYFAQPSFYIFEWCEGMHTIYLERQK